MIRILIDNEQGWIQQSDDGKHDYKLGERDKHLAIQLPSWLFTIEYKHAHYIVKFSPFNSYWRKQYWKKLTNFCCGD